MNCFQSLRGKKQVVYFGLIELAGGCMSVADLRKEYTRHGLLEADVSSDPFEQFQVWFAQALAAQAAGAYFAVLALQEALKLANDVGATADALDAYAVVSNDGELVTVGHRYKRINHY